MRFHPVIVGSFLAVSLSLAVCLGADQPKAEPELQIPAAVLATVKAQLNGGTVTYVNVEEENGKKSFDFQIAKDGKTHGITVAEDGRLLSRQIALEEAPTVVQQKIKQQLGKATLLGIGLATEKGAQSYEVGMKLDGRERSLTISSDGVISSREVFLEETPPAVQKTIREHVGKGELIGIDEVPEEDDIAFDVDVNINGKPVKFTVGRDGALLETQIEFAGLPSVVQKAVNANRGSSEVKNVEARFDGNRVSYEVDLASPAGAHTYTFLPGGALSSLDIPLAEAPEAVQKTIAARLGGGTVDSVEKVIEGKNVIFEVEVGGGAKGEVALGADGSLLSQRVFLGALPLLVQASARKIVGDGFILRVDQSLSEKIDGVFPYTVHARKDYKDFDFLLGPDGKYLGLNQ
ncbi:MAG TPA: hypothetical protein VGH90_05175 [Chthoniobacteraceae bacterium]